MPLVIWTAVILFQVVPRLLARRKQARQEELASQWPSVAGKIRNGYVKLVGGRPRLTLTYDSFESGHGIELYEITRFSKPEAEHAAKVLTGIACVVYYNPECPDETTLLWRDLKAILARDPYVPQIMPLSRVGYRWMAGLGAASVAGLTASVVLFGIAMSGRGECVCEAMMALFAAAPVVAVVTLTGPMGRMMAGAPRDGMLSRLKFALPKWRLGLMATVLLAAVSSFVHYAPQFRALPRNADVPDSVFAGTIGVLLIPIYLFAVLITIEGLRRLRPLEERVRVPTVV